MPLINADEGDGPYGCCNVCTKRLTEECDQCNDADNFELDEALLEESQQLAAA